VQATCPNNVPADTWAYSTGTDIGTGKAFITVVAPYGAAGSARYRWLHQ
jgi:hypothetical protein